MQKMSVQAIAQSFEYLALTLGSVTPIEKRINIPKR